MRQLYHVFGILVSLCIAGFAMASDLPSMTGTGDSRTMVGDTRVGCGSVIEVTGLPYSTNSTLVGAGDDCGIRMAQDHIYHVIIPAGGSYTFSLCGGTQGNTDTYIYLMTGCCTGTEIARDNDGCGIYGGPAKLECITLNRGDYYLIVEAAYPQMEGPYSLTIEACTNACDDQAFQPGTQQVGETHYRYVQTVDANSEAPYYDGPWMVNYPCEENQEFYGFDHVCWYQDDFGWFHDWPDYNSSAIASVDSAFIYICAWDVDEPCPIAQDNRQAPCELDYITFDYNPDISVNNGAFLMGVNQGWSVTKIPVSLFDITSDGELTVFANIDLLAQSCNWAALIHRSQLVVYYTVNRPPFTPEIAYPNCVTTDSTICVEISGPFPADPDDDSVTPAFRWFLWNDLTGGWDPVTDANDDPCLLPGQTETGETYKVEVFVVDEHYASSDTAEHTFNIAVDCGSNPPIGYDFGDLDPECYPTGNVEQGGPSHPIRLENVAWLGDSVTVDVFPNTINLDGSDDGVVFVDSLNWIPCEQVCVDITVTTGPAFNPQFHSLYVYGFKDGSYPPNCSFGDRFCDGQAYECIIQGEEVTDIGPNSSRTIRYCFTDPGVQMGQGRYDGVLRFRLLTEYLSCPAAVATNDPIGGETEDYIIPDLQLPVELLGFTAVQNGNAVVLNWETASELDNDYFRIERRSNEGWSNISGRIEGAGSSTVSHTYSFTDDRVEVGTTYEYRLIAVDINGTAQALAVQSVPVTPQAPSITEYQLHMNYPNPFNPTTTIAFDLVDAGRVSLRIYDVMGREVAALVEGYLPAGHHTRTFDAKGLPSGLYMYKITAGNFTDMKKMVLLK